MAKAARKASGKQSATRTKSSRTEKSGGGTRASRRSAIQSASPKPHRSLWQGAIAFGLVRIPVRLAVAERSRELSFHQLDRRDRARIRYERVNEQTGQKVDYSDIVKGYELDDGSVVVMEAGDFEKAAVEATHTIDILDLVEQDEIPTSYFERPYFILPDRGGSKPYVLIRDALRNQGVVAIGLVVIRSRQHLCAILPSGSGLMLELLRFDEELISRSLPPHGRRQKPPSQTSSNS